MAAHHNTVTPFIPPYSLGVDFDEPQPMASMRLAIEHAITALQEGQADTVICIMDAAGRTWSAKRLANGEIIDVPF